MKRISAALLLLLCVTGAWARSDRAELLGEWIAEPMLVEMEDGNILDPGALYAFPYLGIQKVRFIDSDIVVFTAGGQEYRAFYDTDVLDFDNYHIRCTFRNNEEFILKLVKVSQGWKFLYRIAAGSVLSGESDAEEKDPSDEEAYNGDDGPVDDVTDESADADPVYSIYFGVLKRK